MCSFLLLLALVLLSFASPSVAVPDVSFVLNSDFSATIRVNGLNWLRTDTTWFHANNATFSTGDGSLVLAAPPSWALGIDSLGSFNATSLSWQPAAAAAAPPSGLSFQTVYRVYSHPDSPGSVQAVVFSQVWLSGAADTSVGDSDAVASGFPTFRPRGAATSLGAMQWSDGFDSNTVFVYSGSGASLPLARGGVSGPLVLFDKRGRTTAVLSPYSSFMSASSAASKAGTVEFGLVGSMQSVPPGYTLDTIAVFGDAGITEGVLGWGDALLGRYGKRRQAYLDEFTTAYLGYCTDNGAYYYYHTEQDKDYEATLKDVAAYALQAGIPYRHMLLDSWFYYKGKDGGVKNWTARPDIFPSGLAALHTALQLPFTAHNRWWAPETDYARQNGGQYDFVFGNDFGLPTEQRFWDDLLRNSSLWGLRVYEQDWLLSVWDGLPQIRQDVGLGRRWLIQMGAAAARVGINLQYCMPYPRHILQSVEIPNVVQARASGDNVPGNDYNWLLGESDLLLYALGIAPFKDTFWTTGEQPGNPYNRSEPSPGLNAAVATLSTGPVYPGDAVGSTDVALLSRSHRADGLLLKPDRPAFSLDISYLYRAFGAGAGPDARQLTATYTLLSGSYYHVVLVAGEAHNYTLQLSDLQAGTERSYLTFYYHNGSLSLPAVRPLSRSSPLPLAPAVSRAAFTLHYASPVLSNGLVLLGETSKWVPVSRQRLTWYSEGQQGVVLGLQGGAAEEVKWSWAMPQQGGGWMVMATACTLNEEGRAVLSIGLDMSTDCNAH